MSPRSEFRHSTRSHPAEIGDIDRNRPSRRQQSRRRRRSKSLEPRLLSRPCDPALLDFATTAELTDTADGFGQARAVEAVQFGIDIQRPGYNLFVLGEPGSGRHSVVRRLLEAKAAQGTAPSDWCYVNNFAEAEPAAPAAGAGRPRWAVEARHAAVRRGTGQGDRGGLRERRIPGTHRGPARGLQGEGGERPARTRAGIGGAGGRTPAHPQRLRLRAHEGRRSHGAGGVRAAPGGGKGAHRQADRGPSASD